jgi:hypothetical protein
VRPTELTRGILAFSVILAVYAVIFDDTGALAACLLLPSYLVFQAFWFVRKASATLESLTISRKTDKRIVRQGKDVRVGVVVRLRLPQWTEVTIQERLPSGSFVRNGPIYCRFDTPECHEATLSYDLTLYQGGAVTFPGSAVDVSDTYFFRRFIVGTGQVGSPTLRVEPVSLFRHSGKNVDAIKSSEHERISLLRGLGIRNYRIYIPGDDYRHIDWKLSAKTGNLMIREYSGTIPLPPLVICDLPDNHQGTDEKGFNRITGAVAAYVHEVRRKYLSPPVAVISGANLLDYIPAGTPPQTIEDRMKAAWRPRLFHAYRWPDPARQRAIQYQGHDYPQSPAAAGKSCCLPRVLLEFSGVHVTPTFESTIERLLALEEGGEAILFSLAEGDMSHIEVTARTARRSGKRFHLGVPTEMCSQDWLKRMARISPDGVTRFS